MWQEMRPGRQAGPQEVRRRKRRCVTQSEQKGANETAETLRKYLGGGEGGPPGARECGSQEAPSAVGWTWRRRFDDERKEAKKRGLEDSVDRKDRSIERIG